MPTLRQLGVLAAVALVMGPVRSPAAPAVTDAEYQQVRTDFLELTKDAKRNRFRHHWNPIVARLSRSAEGLPKGQRKCEAQFNLGRAWQEISTISFLQDDRDQGARAFRNLADRCPSSSLADDALFHAASLTARADPQGARRDLERLLSRYPKGDMAPQARELLATLPPAAKTPPKAPAAVAAASTSKASTSAARASASAPAKPSPAATASASGFEKTSVGAASASAPSTSPSAIAAAAPSSPTAGAAGASAATVAGASLPSATDILAALDARGADAFRPADVALAADLAADRAASPAAAKDPAAVVGRAPEPTPPPAGKAAAPTVAANAPDPERLHALEGAVGREIPLSLVAGLKVKRVVVDAGHGGKDTGAIGKNGQREKDLTLAIARKLRTRLRAMGLEVILTRDSDEFLSLEERTRIANDQRADLFISIHVNAANNRNAHGIETYTLNLNSDRYAMRLAARENATSTRSIGDLDLILADLATKANTDDSVRLARLAQTQMVTHLRSKHGDAVKDLGVKQALFFVLVGAKMPAMLVETGFISNADEAKRLASAAYQEAIARSLSDGVRRFIEEREAIARGDSYGSTGVF